ncbi:MAG: hypothetical protein GY847_40270 [Proteobacteria bacterium]|nr:hypothetical protein [Pseudomonadota bacterium]
MKQLDASPKGIFDISWSPDGKWLAYVAGDEEIRLANVESGEIRVIGPGRSPSMTGDLTVVLERSHEILLVTGAKTKTLVTKKDIVKESPKQCPILSPDGSLVLLSVCNVFDKESQSRNAFSYRHFLALAPLSKGKPILTDEQWYGGSAVWFPNGERFAHFEFDSTAGPQVHIVRSDGKHDGTVAGLYPSISPDGSRIAVRPRGGGSLVVYTSKGSWENKDIDTVVLKIPSGSSSRASATPAIWLDNRLVIVDEGGQLWRIDTKRDKADEAKKIPMPTQRRKHSMIASPARDLLAIEVAVDNGFELRVANLG